MATQRSTAGLPQVLEALRRRWFVALLVAVPVAAGAFVYTERLPSQYDGVAVVALAPRPQVSVGADTLRVLAPSYVAYVRAPSTLAGAALRHGLTTAQVDSAVDASVANDTATLTIRARLEDPSRAAAVANDLADVAVRFSQADKLLSATVVSSAAVPTTPSRPRRHLIEAAGILAGLLLGAAAAVAMVRLRPRIGRSTEITEVTGHPVVGRIPATKVVRRDLLAALDDPVVGAGVRSLRTHLDYEGRGAPVRVLAVTSSVPAEGKSLVSTLLAASIARLDAHVLLVDADLQHPSGVERLGVTERPGLARLLRGESTLTECVAEVPSLPQLSVLPAVYDTEGGDLIARRFFALLGQARGRYDVVVVDCPPLLVGDAARTLVRQSDGVILVVKNGLAVRDLAAADATLDALGARVLGVVHNRARREGGTSTETYGSYGERPAGPRTASSFAQRRTS